MIEQVELLGQIKDMFGQMGDLQGSNRLVDGVIKTCRLKQETPEFIVLDEFGNGARFLPHALTFFFPDRRTPFAIVRFQLAKDAVSTHHRILQVRSCFPFETEKARLQQRSGSFCALQL